MNDSLFAWVIENLTKNAVDAMEGQGEITFQMEERDKTVRIDITDSRKGDSQIKNIRLSSIPAIRPRSADGDSGYLWSNVS